MWFLGDRPATPVNSSPRLPAASGHQAWATAAFTPCATPACFVWCASIAAVIRSSRLANPVKSIFVAFSLTYCVSDCIFLRPGKGSVNKYLHKRIVLTDLVALGRRAGILDRWPLMGHKTGLWKVKTGFWSATRKRPSISDLARWLCCASNRSNLSDRTSKFGWLQAPATVRR
jgi:hypothetical protein